MRTFFTVAALSLLLGACVSDSGGRFNGAYGGVSGAVAKPDR